MLIQNKAKYTEICGDITEAYLYRLLFEHNGDIIWFRDIVRLLRGMNSINLLKSATETETERLLTKNSYSKAQSDLPKYLQDFADSNAPRCLLIAMRAETALLSGRIADAISLTVTFWDAAILDAIEQNLPVEAINEVENRIIFSSDYEPDPKLVPPVKKKDAQESGGAGETYLCPENKIGFRRVGSPLR